MGAVGKLPLLKLGGTRSTEDPSPTQDPGLSDDSFQDLPPIGFGFESLNDRSSASNRLTAQAAQRLTEQSLGSLAPIADSIGCILAQPELDSVCLGKLGFTFLRTADRFIEDVSDLKEPLLRAHALLVVTMGSDVAEVLRVAAAVNTLANSPTLIVVNLVPFLGCASSFDTHGTEDALSIEMRSVALDPYASKELGRSLSQVRAKLLSEGADDVISLFAGETLKPHRVIETIQRSEHLSQRVNELIDRMVSQGKFGKQGLPKEPPALPDSMLPHIPAKDLLVQELYDEGEQLTGIGDYSFAGKLGSGNFGCVYKAEHPELGTCAVKVFSSKRSTKSASQLLGLDRELCFLLYLEPHPNLIRAREVIHGKTKLCCAMEYAGRLDLRKFMDTLPRHGSSMSLPKVLVASFAGQQGAAVSHLHGALVCHRDLKPENWIVSDCGERLRLADLGLAAQLCSASQPLRQACGSLPYCAPEVYKAGEKKSHLSYNGLAADIWSLGLGFMELTLGCSVGKVLGWCPQPPQQPAEVMLGLNSLVEHWEKAAKPQEDSGLLHAISNMVMLLPATRWSMGHVLGTRGLASGQQVRAPRSGFRANRLRIEFATAPPGG